MTTLKAPLVSRIADLCTFEAILRAKRRRQRRLWLPLQSLTVVLGARGRSSRAHSRNSKVHLHIREQ